MAVLVLTDVKQQEYRNIFNELAGNEELWLHDLEKEKFSFCHQTVGSLMAEADELQQSMI